MAKQGITAEGPLSRAPIPGDSLTVEHVAWDERSGHDVCTFEVVTSEGVSSARFFGDLAVYPGAAVRLGPVGIPPTLAYRYDHPVGLAFARDEWAAALADAVDALEDFTAGRGLVVLLENDLVGVVDTEPDLGREPLATAEQLAAHLRSAAEAGTIRVPVARDPTTPPELEYLGRFVDGIIVPSGAAPGAVRIHRREAFGPEVESRLAVTWRESAPAREAFIRLRTTGVDGRIDDENLASRALAAAVGDARAAASGVALSPDGAVALIGIDDPTGWHDDEVARAADRLRSRWPLPVPSPGLAALAEYLVPPGGRPLDPSQVASHVSAVQSRDGCSSTSVAGLGPDGATVVAAWYTRQRPGPTALVDLDPRPGGVEVVVHSGTDDDVVETARRFAERTPSVAPARLHASTELVLAVGWRQEPPPAPRRRFGRRPADHAPPGPTEATLVRLLTSIPRHDLSTR